MRSHPRRQRSAMTLLEALFAVALFGLVMALVLEGLAAGRTMVATGDARTELEREAQRVAEAMLRDLGNSAWLISAGTDIPLMSYATGTGFSTTQMRNAILYDREQARYYPYLFRQDDDSLAPGHPFYDAFRRDDDEILDIADLSDGELLPPAWRLPSTEMIFLRVSAGPPVANPGDADQIWVDWNQPPAPMHNFALPQPTDGTTAPPLIDSLHLATDVLNNGMPLAWETFPGADPFFTTGANVDRADVDQLREFTYALVPGGRYGALLQRRYRDGAGSDIQTDQTLSDLVTRIDFDSYRSDTTLGLNQVRVRLWLALPARSVAPPFTHYYEFTIAMRSTVDPTFANDLQGWLGSAGSFPKSWADAVALAQQLYGVSL